MTIHFKGIYHIKHQNLAELTRLKETSGLKGHFGVDATVTRYKHNKPDFMETIFLTGRDAAHFAETRYGIQLDEVLLKGNQAGTLEEKVDRIARHAGQVLTMGTNPVVFENLKDYFDEREQLTGTDISGKPIRYISAQNPSGKQGDWLDWLLSKI